MTMKPITFRQLRDALNELTEDQLDASVSVADLEDHEIYSIFDTMLLSSLPEKHRKEFLDVLEDENHPLLIFSNIPSCVIGEGKMKVRFFDIVWDTTENGSQDQLSASPTAESCGLPSETILEVDDDIDLDTEGADALSDKYGYCVFDYKYEIV